MTRVHQLLERQLVLRPQGTAVMDHDGRRVSFAALADLVEAAAEGLRHAGVTGGHRVLLVGENCMALAAFVMACSRLDAWAVSVNARLAGAELDRIVAHCEPRVMVFFSHVSPEAAVHAARWKAAPFVLAAGDFDGGTLSVLGALPAAPEAVETDAARQVAAMLYTSGTTGDPKGVMLTHRNFLYVARETAKFRSLEPGDHVYGVLPMSHIFGLASVFIATIEPGATVELVPRFEPAHLAEALADRVTILSGVPTMYSRLWQYLDQRGLKCEAPHLRYLSSGGAPLDISWRREVEARFGVILNNGYGLTETTAPAVVNRPDEARDDDSVGRPIDDTETRVVSEDGADVAPGVVGELWLRGPGIMRGYYRNPEATAAVLRQDGWFKTGDLARRDLDGAHFIVGRAKELIIRSGFNVYPGEVEAAIIAYPGVVNAVVVGQRHDGDEAIVAFVQPVEGEAPDEAALMDHLRATLAAYKRPTHLVFKAALPAAATGKILRHKLADAARALVETSGSPQRF